MQANPLNQNCSQISLTNPAHWIRWLLEFQNYRQIFFSSTFLWCKNLIFFVKFKPFKILGVFLLENMGKFGLPSLVQKKHTPHKSASEENLSVNF